MKCEKHVCGCSCSGMCCINMSKPKERDEDLVQLWLDMYFKQKQPSYLRLCTCTRSGNSWIGMASAAEEAKGHNTGPASKLSSLESQTSTCNQFGSCCFPALRTDAQHFTTRRSSVSHFVMYFLRKWPTPSTDGGKDAFKSGR